MGEGYTSYLPIHPSFLAIFLPFKKLLTVLPCLPTFKYISVA